MLFMQNIILYFISNCFLVVQTFSSRCVFIFYGQKFLDDESAKVIARVYEKAVKGVRCTRAQTKEAPEDPNSSRVMRSVKLHNKTVTIHLASK